MAKRRNRIYRRIAVALTVALLVGQSHAFVLAEEAADVAPTEISSEEKTDVETGEDIRGADTDGEEENGDADDGDAGNAGENDEEITGDETDPETGAENGEEETPEETLEENVSGNGDEIEEVGEPEEALAAAEDGIETYAAVNDRFNVDGISYRVDDVSEKEVSVYGAASEANLVNVEIPATVTDDEGEEWKVTKISGFAFELYGNLVSVKIADGITEIGNNAFHRCDQLESVELPNSVTRIGDGAFADCKKLTNINIPNQLTYMGIDAIGGCSNLAIDVVIPGSLTEIEPRIFVNCPKLTNVTIPDTVTRIRYSAFEGCSNLSVLNIAVNTGNPVVPIPLEDATVFKNCSPVRRIVFKNADGTAELTGAELEAAKRAYLEVNDGDVNDGKWYGWWIDDPIVYAVNIEAYKDDQLWSDSGKEFVLRLEDSSSPLGSYVTDLSMVEKGEYSVWEIAEDRSKVSTEVKVSVADSDVSPRVDYYTVTFYDGETAYGDDTDQRSQIVIKRGKASRPSNPSKNGFTFDKWVTDDKATQFNFNSWITQPTSIYATWNESAVTAYKVTINVMKDKQPWAGHGRTFALLPNGGSSFITDLNQVPNGTYRIYDITGVPAASLYSKARDTGIDVQVDGVDTEVNVAVNDANAEAEINYYTATFYDRDTAYGANTDQRPQIVLNGKQVAEPEAPSKAGYLFNGWVTENGGSTSFDFDAQIRDTTNIFASWRDDDSVVPPYIVATASAGGTIDPIGRIHVNEGANQTFVITPSNGYRIQSVIVDRVDMTEAVKAAGNSYTFTDVRTNHTIDATFEADGSDPGGNGGDNSGDGDNNNSGGGGNGGNNNSGGGNGGGGHTGSGDNDGGNSDGGNGDGDNSGGENGGGSDPGDGNATAGGNFAAGSGGNGTVSGGSTVSSQNSVSVDNSKSAGNGSGNTASGSKEPKTGDASQAEVYATIAMIAGLTYLLLYFMEEGRGMSEREKDAFVAAFVRWAKKGGAFRRCCAMVAIFCILAYYHSIGKRIGGNALNEKYLGQVL